MKKYEKPDIEVVKYFREDILTDSKQYTKGADNVDVILGSGWIDTVI